MSLADDIASLTGLNYRRWNSEGPVGTPIVVTYTFPAAPSPSDPHPGFVAFGEQHKVYARAALSTWAAASGIEFVEVPETAGGQIRFSFVDMTGSTNATGNPLSGEGFAPNVTTTTGNGAPQLYTGSLDGGGDVFLNAIFYSYPQYMAPGIRGYSILLHEVGHALGFKHPFEGEPRIEGAHDNGAFTIMSYNRSTATTQLAAIDIAASKLFYGATDAIYAWDPATLSLTITGTNGSEARIGTELNDTINGLAGADLLIGKRGADTLNGGDGVDTALLQGFRAQYAVTMQGAATIVADSTTGRDGIDTLIDVERLRFADQILAFDVDGNAGQAYRLYQAAFARAPDQSGLSFWVDKRDDGLALSDIAAGFVNSAEFRNVYGAALTAEQIVARFYENVLGRAGEAGGTNYWVSAIENGVSVAEVLAGFSESAENVARVAPLIGQAISLDTIAFV